MTSAVRPWITTGIALVGASVIAVGPVTPVRSAIASETPVPATQVAMPEVHLTASVAEIFTFPAFRQYVVNQITDLVVLGAGLAESGVGLGESIGAIPQTLVTVTQQVLSGDLLGALNTLEVALITAASAVILPTLEAVIYNRQRSLAVQSALQQAVPLALVQFGGGLLGAFNAVAEETIIAGQDLVAAIVSLDLPAVVDALVDGTVGVLTSFVEAGGQIVDGTVAAQQTLATALAAQPPTLLMEARTMDSGIAAEFDDGNLATFTVDTSSVDNGRSLATEGEGDQLTLTDDEPAVPLDEETDGDDKDATPLGEGDGDQEPAETTSAEDEALDAGEPAVDADPAPDNEAPDQQGRESKDEAGPGARSETGGPE